ncbi:hypothetical protein PUN4_180087 [Paraburkholderia unamae]|nr:hypothetical protein PUN4_180087 [Paraburkholderia unamae]
MKFVHLPAARSRKQRIVAGVLVWRRTRTVCHDHMDILRKRFLTPLPCVRYALRLSPFASRGCGLSRSLCRETEYRDGFVPRQPARNCFFDEPFDEFACFHPQHTHEFFLADTRATSIARDCHHPGCVLHAPPPQRRAKMQARPVPVAISLPYPDTLAPS